MSPSPFLSWVRGFFAAAFGGAADGVLIGLGGAAGVSAVSHTIASKREILAVICVNILLDTARFVKLNPDPLAGIAKVVPPVTVPPQQPPAVIP